MAKKLYVGNLPRSFSSSDLETLFSTYGTVSSAEVIADRITGQSRGFGFVQMESQQASQEAMQALDGSDVEGRQIAVNEARERQPRTGGGGRPGGGGSGGRPGGSGGGRGRPRGYGRGY
jgi:RNA recognition motif-containing protein